jgi:hypothetical protein
MVEIEWDGVDLPADAQRSLRDRLRALASMVDPDGRARLQVVIASDAGEYAVSVDGRDDVRRMGAEVRDGNLKKAITRAIDLAMIRWEAALARAA